LEIVLAGMEGAESLVQRLSKYTKGTWAGFINQPTNVDINKKLVVFSIRDMEDELRPIGMYLITHYIWNVIRKDLKKRGCTINRKFKKQLHQPIQQPQQLLIHLKIQAEK
jgi:hypothetical protein